jgi:hypothetical protein
MTPTTQTASAESLDADTTRLGLTCANPPITDFATVDDMSGGKDGQ